MRTPLAPSGWPMATAPPRGLYFSGSGSKARCHMQAMAANASLTPWRRTARSHPRALEQALGHRDRGRQHDGRVLGPHGEVGEPGPDGQPEPLGHPPLGDEHGAGPVGGLRGVAGGDVGGGVGLPALGRLEGGQRLHGAAPPDPLVGLEALAGERAVLGLDGDGDGLFGKVATVPGLGGPAVALQAEGVHLLPADCPAVGQQRATRNWAHRRPSICSRKLGGTGRCRLGIRGHRDPAHHLDAAGHHQVVVPGDHTGGAEVHGLLGRAALAVDGGGRHVLGQPGRHPARCGTRSCSAPHLGDAAADDVVDAPRVHPGALDQGRQGEGQQVDRVSPCRAALQPAWKPSRHSCHLRPLWIARRFKDQQSSGSGHAFHTKYRLYTALFAPSVGVVGKTGS